MPGPPKTNVTANREHHLLVAAELARYHDRSTQLVADAQEWLEQNKNRSITMILVPWSPAEAQILRCALRNVDDGMILAASPRVAWAKRRANARAGSPDEIPAPRT